MSADIRPDIRRIELSAIVRWTRTHGASFAAYLRFWRIDAASLSAERRERLHAEWKQTRARMRYRAALLARS
jgi:hypothetical protein